MVDQMDALGMTVEDLVDEEPCVNCHGEVDEFGHEVQGWGMLCDMCYEDMWGARLDLAYAYGG